MVQVQRVLLIGVGTLSGAVLVTAVGLRAGATSTPAPTELPGVTVDLLPALALLVPGLLVQWRRPHRVGVVLLVCGALWAVNCLAASWQLHAPGLPGQELAAWYYARVGAVALLPVPLVLALWPDERLPRDRWRWPVRFVVTLWCALPVLLVLAPLEVVHPAFTLLAAPSLLVVLARLVVLTRDRDLLRRTRSRWMVWAALVCALTSAPISLPGVPEVVTVYGVAAGVALVAAVAAIGLLRPDLADVDRLLAGTVVYTLVVLSVVLVDVLLVATLVGLSGIRLGDRDALLAAALLVTAVYGPVRERLWRAVRRWVLGERDDPYRVLSLLAAALEAGDSVEIRLHAVADAVVRAFRLGWAGIEVGTPELAVQVETGPRPDRVRRIPLQYGDQRLGAVLVPATGSGGRASRRDERLLLDVCRQAAVALRAENLTAALQTAGAEVVTASWEDRRRIRRDLHDGLGPTLAAAGLGVDRARNLLARDPEQAGAILGAVRHEVGAAVQDVRRLVSGLRPPALDELGLAGALRALADRFGGPELGVDVEVPDTVGIPAAAEVAVYRITAEALTNVVRHSGASRVHIALQRFSGVVVLDVVDDGVGVPTAPVPGTGLASMRRRAQELNGSLELTGEDPGTRLRAVLPTPDEDVA